MYSAEILNIANPFQSTKYKVQRRMIFFRFATENLKTYLIAYAIAALMLFSEADNI